MSQAFSPIQNKIISKLKNASTLRYSDLYPKNIPNDLFNYHLQFLVKKGLVKRSDNGYSLGDAGVKHVADPDIATGDEKIASTFKVNVITLVSRGTKNKIEILNQIRTSHPSFGKVGAMGGIVRKGESLEEAARRKLKVETGLVAKFKIYGIERRMMYAGNQLFSDILFPIAYTNYAEGELTDTEFGHNMWVSIDEAIKNESGGYDTIKMIPYILAAVRGGSISKLPFFYKEDVQSK